MSIMADIPITMASFAVPGGELEGDIRSGDAKRAPVLFLHGWTLDRRMWVPQMAALKTSRRLIAIDRRGFGKSTAPPDLHCEADDIIAVIDVIKADKVIVVGMSQSGRVAVDFALKYPARVAGVILQGARLGAEAQVKKTEEIPISLYIELAREGRLDEMKTLWRSHALMQSGTAEGEALIDKMLADYEARDLTSSALPAPEFDAMEIAKITAPALVITGAEDTPHRRRVADDLSNTIPNARQIEIPDAGHLCNLNAPDAFNAAVSEFLNGLQA
jgi:pimeloyl-ACP methyl ester carboxylesterase